jgi:hypothetical protein
MEVNGRKETQRLDSFLNRRSRTFITKYGLHLHGITDPNKGSQTYRRNVMTDYKKALQELHDACDELNNKLGSKTTLCQFCNAKSYDASGFVHYEDCPLLKARKVLSGKVNKPISEIRDGDEEDQETTRRMGTVKLGTNKFCTKCGRVFLEDELDELPDHIEECDGKQWCPAHGYPLPCDKCGLQAFVPGSVKFGDEE